MLSRSDSFSIILKSSSNFSFNSATHWSTNDGGVKIKTFFTKPLMIHSFKTNPAVIVFPSPTSSAKSAEPLKSLNIFIAPSI